MALTYSITGGADAAKFNINATSGALTFKAAPDFEHPGDADANNIYIVEVGVSDGTTVTKQVINVTVSNVADENLPPQFTSPAAFTVPENQTTVATLTATDPDAGGGTPPPVTGDYPNATNTGAKGTLTPHAGELITTSHGQIIKNMDIAAHIWVSHRDVKIQNTKCDNILAGHENFIADGLLVEDVTIVGGSWGSGISMVRATNAIVRRCNISGVENAFWCQAGNVTIQDNWMHDLASDPDDPHYDGFQCPSGNNGKILHNNFDLVIGVSSCMSFNNNTNALVQNNRIHGGTYCIYFEAGNTGCRIDHNDFVDCTYGWTAGATWNQQTFTQNTFKGGAPIDGLPKSAQDDATKAEPRPAMQMQKGKPGRKKK